MDNSTTTPANHLSNCAFWQFAPCTCRPAPEASAPAQAPGRRPLFDGADIFRLNELAKKFPQWEFSERWKRLWPFIAWAVEVSDAPGREGDYLRALLTIRKKCFDDSEWGRYIDQVFKGTEGGPEAPETAALLALLKRIEWHESSDYDECPSCGRHRYDRPRDCHYPTCELAAQIKALEAAPASVRPPSEPSPQSH